MLQTPNLISNKNVTMTGVLSPSSDPDALNRLAEIQAVLQGQGITDLANLGTLPISGTLKPVAGTLVRAPFVRGGPGGTFGNVGFTTASGKVLNANHIVTLAPNFTLSTPGGPGTVFTVTPSGPGAVFAVPPGGPAPGPAGPFGVLGTGAALPPVAPAAGPAAPPVAPAARPGATPIPAASLPPLTVGAAAIPTLTSAQFSGPALRLIGQPLPSAQSFQAGLANAKAASVIIPINTAYWAANTITFAPDTKIVLDKDVRFLVIIALSITGAANVTLTYEDIPEASRPGIPGTPQTPLGQPSVPSGFSTGSIGYGGAAGTSPLQVSTPPDAPEIELWVLNIDGLPTVLLKGQRGYTGVQGGDGQQGGTGGNGSAAQEGFFNCDKGPGNGGKGGPGGRAGDGGPGGNGGLGGRFSLYTATNISGFPFLIDVSGGDGGVGGLGGNGGKGGAGGKRGSIPSGFCDTAEHRGRPDGSQGDSGGQGNQGPSGLPGTFAPNAEKFVTIVASDFLIKLTDPAITSITKANPIVNVGTTITINGLRFTPTDQVTVGGVAATSNFVANTMLQCVVPNTAGGVSRVQVTRSGGTNGSNYATLFITPTVISTIPANLARLRPGTLVQLRGTGFSPQTTVRINGTQITLPSSADTQFMDTQNIKFMMKRPNSVPRLAASASAEPALLSVASGGPILPSNAISIMIATYQIVTIGDSIAWGEGLQKADKWSTKVEEHVTAANAGISVYMSGEPHTGAILGWNGTTGGTHFNGDIPKSYPSVHQQARDLAALPNASTVDLILITATANDVGSNSWLDPGKSPSDILPRVTKYCHDDMLAFLGWLAGAFTAAKIIVTGYYPMVSHDSNPNFGVDVVAVYVGLDDNKGLLPAARAIAMGLNVGTQPKVASNTEYFAAQANLAISLAVKDANQALNPARIYYADPGFGTKNAANAPNAWVFGIDVTLLGLQPTDSPTSANLRATQCQVLNSLDRVYCDVASTGHPNESGALAYAKAIIALL